MNLHNDFQRVDLNNVFAKERKKNRLSNDDNDIFINDAYILAVIMKPEDNTNT